jgi:DNA-binding SARP family transcriptional activator
MPSYPFARIITFGPLELLGRVEASSEDDGIRYAPLSTDRLNGRGATAAFALLKIMLCQPQRHAPRDLLMELLWPEQAHRRAGARLDDAASVLRILLRPASGENPLEYRHSNRDSGNSYHLAPYPLIWVDTDAFEWYVAQACRLERFGEDALPLWEEAYHLAARGAFLADELYSEWARERRALLAGHYRQCVHEMTRLYRERGAQAEAERVLREHLAREPMDEDALRPFMELSGEKERYQEASDAYQRTQEALAQEGRAPDERTQDIAEYLRAKKITRTRVATALLTSSLEPERTTHLLHRSRSVPLSTQTLLQAGQSGSDMDMLRVLFALEERQDMSLLSRRQLLELGIAAFISRLAKLDGKHISSVEREELGHALGESGAAGWKLFLKISNAEVLAVSKLQLSLLHEAHALLYPVTRSYLYAGMYGLLGLALHFEERDEEAMRCYHNAQLAAIATGDPWYIAQNLICQADTYLTLGMNVEALQAIEEALLGLGEIDEEHRRARSHLLSCWADVSMSMGEYALAQKKLDEALHYLNGDTIIEEFDRTTWLQLAGKKALMAGEYQQAINHLEEALALNPPHWVVRHAGILTPLAIAYARMRERDQSLLIARQTIPVVKAVNAPMINTYFLEYIKDDILGRFPHDNNIHTFLLEVQQQLAHFPAFIEAP